MSNKLELAKKLKALAEKGVGGEKENAEKMLKDFMRKHGISDLDLEENKVTENYLNIDEHDLLARKLLAQIAALIYPKANKYLFPKADVKKYKLGGNYMIECPICEFIEISQKYEFYLALMKKELNSFVTAFFMANDLLVKPSEDEDRDYTDEEIAAYIKAQGIAKNIEKGQFNKQLTHAQKP